MSTTELATIPNGQEIQASYHVDNYTLEAVVNQGNLSKLEPQERVLWYRARCDAAGLDYRTQPFEYLLLKGKLKLYATKTATDQLINKRKITVKILGRSYDDESGIYEVHCSAEFPDGRTAEDIGALFVKGLKGEDLANARMKTVTKAKRRTVLSACGLGMLDETETESIHGARRVIVNEDGVIDTEIVAEAEPPPVKSAKGIFGKDHQKKVPTFLGWLTVGCTHHIKEWRAAWDSDNIEKWGDSFPFPAERAETWMADGFAVPEKIKDPINTFQAKGHLWKWAVNSGLIPDVADHRGAKPAQVDAFLAKLYDDPAGFEAMTLEMRSYVAKAKADAATAIYRDFPHLDPDGASAEANLADESQETIATEGAGESAGWAPGRE